MKFQYLGTCAAEGIPALLCDCARCVRSREIGGRAIRTRSQALIDGKLLIDFPPDTYMHRIVHGFNLLDVDACIVTHAHHDHFFPEDLDMLRPNFSHTPEGWHMDFFGSDRVIEKVSERTRVKLEELGMIDFCTIKPFDTFTAGGYRVTALPARHDPNSGPVFYQISDGEKTVLYGNDTHFFMDSVWEYWQETKPHFDMVSLDCTNACLPLNYVGHMGLTENAEVRRRMLEMGLADDKTVFICNHFSHNGTNVVYDDFVLHAAKEGFLVSYDGMIVNI